MNEAEKRARESAAFAQSNSTFSNFIPEFALHVSADNGNDSWILDSACSSHMTGDKEDIVDFKKFPDDKP